MLLIHMTAAYSNAVLVAILPHISDCAKGLGLPVPIPVIASHVDHARISPWKEEVGGSFWLTNHCQFVFANGYVKMFRDTKNNPFYAIGNKDKEPASVLSSFVGMANMTTNEAIEFARRSFYNLGHNVEDFPITEPPTRFQEPSKLKGKDIPYCRVAWDSPETRIPSRMNRAFNIQFDVDMQQKKFVGMSLSGRLFFRSNPTVNITPELETDFSSAGGLADIAQIQKTIKDRERQITPAFSNAALVATLPYISDFAQRLDLPIPRTLTTTQVIMSVPAPYITYFSETVELTNHYWFDFVRGHITRFGSPDNWFDEKETQTNWSIYGKGCLTTNEAIEFARRAFKNLGYRTNDIRIDQPPTSLEIATSDNGTKYAYCEIGWEMLGENESRKREIQFDVDMRQKRVVGLFLAGSNFSRPNPEVNGMVEFKPTPQRAPTLQMFARTNAPGKFYVPRP